MDSSNQPGKQQIHVLLLMCSMRPLTENKDTIFLVFILLLSLFHGRAFIAFRPELSFALYVHWVACFLYILAAILSHQPAAEEHETHEFCQPENVIDNNNVRLCSASPSWLWIGAKAPFLHPTYWEHCVPVHTLSRELNCRHTQHRCTRKRKGWEAYRHPHSTKWNNNLYKLKKPFVLFRWHLPIPWTVTITITISSQGWGQ